MRGIPRVAMLCATVALASGKAAQDAAARTETSAAVMEDTDAPVLAFRAEPALVQRIDGLIRTYMAERGR